MKKYVIIDNSQYADYFLRNLARDYIPVTLNDSTKAIFESHGVQAAGILDRLTKEKLKEISTMAFTASNKILDRIDEINRKNYYDIFGNPDVRLTQATIGYLFKRFVIASLRLTCGIEEFIRDTRAEEMSYIHDGDPEIMCGVVKNRGFFYPDDITWRILNSSRSIKASFKLIKGYRRDPEQLIKNTDIKRAYMDFIRQARILLSPIKQAVIGNSGKKRHYSSDKRSLLLLTSLCDLDSAASSEDLEKAYNLLVWSPDGRIITPDRNAKNPECGAISVPVAALRECLEIKDMDFAGLAAPLIDEYYKAKMEDISDWWEEASLISKRYDIAAIFWGNSPHRAPHGIIKEFFRLKGVPVCGMQHGGMTGSNRLDQSIFETDFDNCDFYFSYGFENSDLEVDSGRRLPRIVPVGSTIIYKRLKEERVFFEKQKVDLLYPVSLAVGQFYYENEMSMPRLYEFQKKIIDKLAGFEHKKIVLKFPVGKYLENPVGIYVSARYPGKFIVIDHMSFSECLKRYDAGAILIEEQSTPLNEAVGTGSDIIVFNDRDWVGLTDKAYASLCKRAIICDTEEEFTRAVCDHLSEKRVANSRPRDESFMEKYCVYKGDPVVNLESGIRFIAGLKQIKREPVHAK